MPDILASVLPSHVSDEAIACPLCGKPIDPLIAQARGALTERAAQALCEAHADWTPAANACPACAAEAAQIAAEARSAKSLQSELLTPFPVYAEAEAQLLPTPLRVYGRSQYSGRGVTMALLDSGFYPHPDLTRPSNRIVCYVDATDDEPTERSLPRQDSVENWHGLMTSCVAAGNGFLSEGFYTSLAPAARIVLVKTGSPRTRRIRDADIQRALSWVIANQQRFDIRIVNISLGGDVARAGRSAPSALDELVEDAVTRGMVVVAAAGNDGAERLDAPASAPSALAVGGLDDQNSLDPQLRRLYRSNYGRSVARTPKPEVIAPAIWVAAPMLPNSETQQEGEWLWRLLHAPDKQFARLLETPYAQDLFKQSTLRLPFDEIRVRIRKRMIEQKFIHAHYQHVDGTSFAAPIVSALVAQMLEANPSLSPAQVKQMVMATALPLPNAPAEKQGHGAIHAGQAVAAALRAPRGACAGLPFSPYSSPWATNFFYADASAYEVMLVGSFNDWQPTGYALQAHGQGVWQIAVPPLPGGAYPYKFLVNRQRWVSDPENILMSEDGYGGFNSLLVVE